MVLTNFRRAARVALLALMAVALLAVAGCGGDEGGGDAASTPAAEPTPADPPAEATEAAPAGPTIEELTGDGSYESEPPTEGPPAAKGKLVYWVSCGMVIPDCSTPALAAKEAAAKLGIDFKIADGKLNEGGGNITATRLAVSSQADAVIVHGINCATVKQPLTEAKKASVKVMGVEALDCDDPPGTEAGLFTADMQYAAKALSGVDYFRTWGKVTAQYMIADSGGKLKYVYNHYTEPLGENIHAGFEEEIKKCTGCERVDEIKFSASDLIPNGPWLQRLRATLIKNPDATEVMFPFDSNYAVGGGKTAQEVNPKLKQYGGSGQAISLDLVRKGTVTAVTAAHDPIWMGYAAMDNINRVLQGEETVAQGVGFRPVDKEHNLPAKPGSNYETQIDYKAAYEKIWGG